MRPSDAKRIDVADVYKGNRIAGQLVRTREGAEFRYDEQYVHDSRPAVASTLPLRQGPFRTGSGAVPPFFAGVLPEGARLQAVVTAVKTSADDELSLLLAVGSDTVGDVRVVPHGEEPPDTPVDLPTDPTQIRFADLLRRSVDPHAEALDSALPGVQEKISDAMISFPIKRLDRPAILKLEPVAYPLITRNEFFFLSLARRGGFAVPDHELVTDQDGAAGLLIGRFDRAKDAEGESTRIAQEDGCQLLGRYPADKYRVTVNELAEAVAATASAPRVAVVDLMLQIAFSWMIGNGDLHAKNYSLQWREGGALVAATPVYDVISTLPYPMDQHMAMRLDGRDANFQAQYFIDFAERFGVPSKLSLRRLSELADRCEPGLSELGSIGYDAATTEHLEREIRSRLGTLRIPRT